MLYYLSFVEEMVMNPDYKGYIGGRVEVHDKEHKYAIEEIRFFTKKAHEFREFRERWDLEYVSELMLIKLRYKIKDEYYDI